MGEKELSSRGEKFFEATYTITGVPVRSFPIGSSEVVSCKQIHKTLSPYRSLSERFISTHVFITAFNKANIAQKPNAVKSNTTLRHCEERSDVAIRILCRQRRRSAKHCKNGFPRQCEHWLGMT